MFSVDLVTLVTQFFLFSSWLSFCSSPLRFRPLRLWQCRDGAAQLSVRRRRVFEQVQHQEAFARREALAVELAHCLFVHDPSLVKSNRSLVKGSQDGAAVLLSLFLQLGHLRVISASAADIISGTFWWHSETSLCSIAGSRWTTIRS